MLIVHTTAVMTALVAVMETPGAIVAAAEMLADQGQMQEMVVGTGRAVLERRTNFMEVDKNNNNVAPEVHKKEDGAERISGKKIILSGSFAFLALIVAAGAVFVYKTSVKNSSETSVCCEQITNIPYVGRHNNIDVYRQPYARNDVSAALLTVLEYWYPGETDIEKIDASLVENQTFLGFRVMESYVHGEYPNRYDTSIKQLTLEEAAEYMRDEPKTPLIIGLPLIPNQPEEIPYAPAAVLTGIDMQEQTLLFHNYWLGPNHELTFSEFEELQQTRNEESRNIFLIVKPTSERDPSFQLNDTHNIPDVPKETTELYRNYALAKGALTAEEYELAHKYFTAMVDSPFFSTHMAPINRVIVLSRLSNAELLLGNLEKAAVIAQQAVELNKDLDGPFKHLGSYDYLLSNNSESHHDKLSLPHSALGDAYRHLGQTEKAIEQYERALEIYPRHVDQKRVIEQLRDDLSE